MQLSSTQNIDYVRKGCIAKLTPVTVTTFEKVAPDAASLSRQKGNVKCKPLVPFLCKTTATALLVLAVRVAGSSAISN